MEMKFSHKSGFERTIEWNVDASADGLAIFINTQQIGNPLYLIEYGLRQALADSYAIPADFDGDVRDEAEKRFNNKLAAIVAGTVSVREGRDPVASLAWELAFAAVRVAVKEQTGLTGSAFNKKHGDSGAFKRLVDRHFEANRDKFMAEAQAQIDAASDNASKVDLDFIPAAPKPAETTEPKRKGKKSA